jgi:hypothetical protein
MNKFPAAYKAPLPQQVWLPLLVDRREETMEFLAIDF